MTRLPTESLLQETFTRTALNGTRHKWCEIYGMPSSWFTKCPKLNTTLKSKVPKQSKDADNPLAKTQALMLDAVGPLAAIPEHPGVPKDMVEAVILSLRFLGNTSATISCERRRRVGSFLNEDLKWLIDKKEKFKNMADCCLAAGS